MFSLLFSALLSCSQLFSSLLMSSELLSSLLLSLSSSEIFSFQLFPASPFYAACPNSALLSSSPLFSCQVVSTHPISLHLISAYRTSVLLWFSQLFSVLGSSCQLTWCLLISPLHSPPNSSQILAHLLGSGQLWSALLSSGQLFSALVSSSHLISALPAHPQIISALSSLAQNLLQNRIPVPKPQKLPSWCLFLKQPWKDWKAATLAQPFQCSLRAASCKRPWDYVCTSNIEQQWCSHSNAICKRQAVEAKRIALARLKLLLAKPCTKTGSRHQSPNKCGVEALKGHFTRKMDGSKNQKNRQKLIAATSAHFLRDFPQKLKAEDVTAKLSCEMSLKNWISKMCKRSFRARRSSETEIEDVKTNLSCERSLKDWKLSENVRTKLSCQMSRKNWQLKLWLQLEALKIKGCGRSENDLRTPETVSQPPRGRRSRPSLKACFVLQSTASNSCIASFQNAFRARLPGKTASLSCENEVFLWDFPQKLQTKIVKMKLAFPTSLQNCKLKMWKRSFRARGPSKTESRKCENENFVRCYKLKVEIWKRNFRARCPLKIWNWRCENETFVRDVLQKLKTGCRRTGRTTDRNLFTNAQDPKS